MTHCPCCADRLLRQYRHGSLSWFCRTCWTEMPPLVTEEYRRRSRQGSQFQQPASWDDVPVSPQLI